MSPRSRRSGSHGSERSRRSVAAGSAAAAVPQAWVWGAGADLLLGCGLGYLLLALALAALPVAAETLLSWGTLATFLIGMAHYGATLLRVYERPEDRRRYVFFTVWASLAVWVWFAAGVHVALVGSLLLTTYLTWSPWHYSGQNYGLAVMFLRRRGVPLPVESKRPLYLSFLLSYALTFLSMHGGYAAAGYVPTDVEAPSYPVLSLGIPRPVYVPLFGALLLAHVVSLALVVRGLHARRSLARATPALLLLGTQALWFTLPSVALWLSGAALRTEYVVFYFLWVGIAHAAQYLWITSYYAAQSEPIRGRVLYLAKALLAGGLVFAAPALLFAPGVAGRVPFESGLWVLVVATVNIQHFLLDGAIWKLRDGPVARILLAPAAPAAPAARAGTASLVAAGGAAPWLRRGVWAAAAVATAIALGGAWEYERGWVAATARGDQSRAARAERVLAALGRDNPLFYERRAALHLRSGDVAGAVGEYEASLAFFPTYEVWYALGFQRASLGDHAGAIEAWQRSIELHPNPQAWSAIGELQQLVGDDAAALDAIEHALALDPDFVPALHLAGRHWLERGDADRARELLERAAALAPPSPQLASDLRRAQGS